MNRSRTPAAVSAILLALIQVFAFYYFAKLWAFPYDGNATDKMGYLYHHQTTILIVNILASLGFGCLLSMLLAELHHKLKQFNSPLASIGFLFGAIWIGMLVAGGMLSNAGMLHALEMFLSTFEADDPLRFWETITVIVKGIGGAGTAAGGIWILLVSVCALEAEVFSKPLGYLGLFTGLAGVATVYPDDLLGEIFRAAQIVWLIWLGVALLSGKYAGASEPSSTEAADA